MRTRRQRHDTCVCVCVCMCMCVCVCVQHQDVICALADEGIHISILEGVLRHAQPPPEVEFVNCLVANLAASPEGYRALRSWFATHS